MKHIEYIDHDSQTLAIILRHDYKNDGIEFFTPNVFSQQLGYMRRPKDYIIQPHIHKPVKREVHYTKEVLLIKSGKVRVDFYTEGKEFIESRTLNQGDVILLAHGGHGFKMIEDTEMIEIKQGPYVGENDKERFKDDERE